MFIIADLFLTFGPFVVVYIALEIRESGAAQSAVSAPPWYWAGAQLLKLLLTASLSPAAGFAEGRWVVGEEVLRFANNLVDIAVLTLVLRNQRRGSGETAKRLLATAWGWSLSEALCTKLPPLVFAARGLEWTCAHLATSFDANVRLAAAISLTACVWHAFVCKSARHRRASFAQRTFIALLAAHALLPTLKSYGKHGPLQLDALQLVAGEAAFVGVVGLGTLLAHRSLARKTR